MLIFGVGFNIYSQSKISVTGDLFYGFHFSDKINASGIGTSINYDFNTKWRFQVTLSSIFGESRGIVPRKNSIKLSIKDYETLGIDNDFFDHYLKHYPTTFNKFYTFISDFNLEKKNPVFKSSNINYGAGVSIVYFDLEQIDYVYDAKFYRFGGTEEEEYTLIIPRYDRFYDLGINIKAGYEYLFKEYMFFRISPSINYYFKSRKLIFKNSIGLGFYF